MKLLRRLFYLCKVIFRTFETILFVGVLYGIIATFYFKNKLNLESLDNAFLYSLFWWTDETILAPGFSEEKFQQIEIGMKEKEVLRALGKPLQVTSSCPGSVETWHYTSQAPFCCSIYGDQNHQRRSVQLSAAGTVVNKVSEFYFD
jgi:hypothetical protein